MEKIQEKEKQLDERERKIEEKERQLLLHTLQEKSPWALNCEDINITDEVLGRGKWGEVKVGNLNGMKVAVKCLSNVTISSNNLEAFCNEMNMYLQVRHSNILQFIGATSTLGTPIILTEFMPTSLEKELKSRSLPISTVLDISLDVACGINHLHVLKPCPILHKSISSANVLLQYVEGDCRAKISDYGSVSFQSRIRSPVEIHSIGISVYAAPEYFDSSKHSTAMDVFSYGILLMEMLLRYVPLPNNREALICNINETFKDVVVKCLTKDSTKRPKMSKIVKTLDMKRTVAVESNFMHIIKKENDEISSELQPASFLRQNVKLSSPASTYFLQDQQALGNKFGDNEAIKQVISLHECYQSIGVPLFITDAACITA